MAVNLLDMANIAAVSGDGVASGLIESFAMGSPLARAMRIKDIGGSAHTWKREGALSVPGWRSVNEALPESSGKLEKRSVNLKILGHDIDVDNFIVQTGGQTERVVQEMLAAKALGQKVGLTLIKGALVTEAGSTGDPESFDGLQALYGGGFGSSTVSTAGENGGQIVANGGASQALSLYSLDETIQKVTNPTHIIAPKKLKLRLKAYLRSLGALNMLEDDVGKPIEAYGTLPILEADELGNEAAITFTENNNTTASIYVVSLTDNGLVFLQSPGGIRIKDLGEQDSKPVWRTRFEWYMAMADLGKRCVARLYNIADTTAVA